MSQTRLFFQVLLLFFFMKGNYCQAQLVDYYENYTKQAKPCRMYTKVINLPLIKIVKIVESLMEERCIWVEKNPTRTVLKCRSSRTWSGTNRMGGKIGGKRITYTVISFEAMGNSRSALHFCYYVNGKPENDPEKFSWLLEEIELRMR